MATTPQPVQQDPQAQQDGNLAGVVAAALAAGGAVVAGLAPAAAAAVPAVGLALSAAKVAELTAAMIARTRSFMTTRAGQVAEQLRQSVTASHPEITPDRADELVVEEMKREAVFRRKMAARLEKDLPKALAISDPEKRREAIRTILEREQRYLAMREEAMSDRVMMAAEYDVVRNLSPKGAFWKLSPDVLKHTPDCIALGNQWHPWSVIDAVGPPPRHPGCRCRLVTEDEAVKLGYIEKGYADGVDTKDAMARAKKGLKNAAAVQEAVSGEEWDAWLEHLQEAAALKGAMVALYPSNKTAAALSRYGDEATNQIHLTLAFLGKDATELEGDRAAITDAVKKAVAASGPLKGMVGGIGQFRGDGDEQPQIALADVPGIDELRAGIVSALRANKVGHVDNHGFVPHLTLRYAKPGEPLPKMPPSLPLEFDRVHLVWGGQKQAFKLGGALAEAFDPSEPRDPAGKWRGAKTPKPTALGAANFVAKEIGGKVVVKGHNKLESQIEMPDGTKVKLGVGVVPGYMFSYDPPAIVLASFGVEPRRGGTGTKVMEALKAYSDHTDSPFVVHIPADSAVPFYQRFPWLTKHGYAQFGYTPKLQEAYVEVEHPRGRTGQWVAKAVAAAGVKGVDVRKAFGYGSADPSHKQRSEYRMRATEAILDSGTAVRDAVLLLPPDVEQRETLLKKISVGDTKRAFKEFGETPVGDLEVLSGIYVKNHPVSGQANTQMNTRTLTMGTTSVTGDFRHELGHAIRASFGGAGGSTAHTALTGYVAKRHDETMARRQASIKAGLPKPQTHDQWEEQIGVIDPRGFDSWDEDFAEQYRAYQKAVYQTRHPAAPDYNPEALEVYRKRHQKWADLWDAWYTAQLAGRFEEPAVQTALREADVLLEAYDRRYPRGTREGGRFMPRVGAAPHLSLLKRHMLSHLFPELPAVPRGMKRRGEHHVLDGKRVFVPKERVFRRTLGGRVFSSPAGSTSVFTTPVPQLGGQARKDVEVPLEDLERQRGEEITHLDATIAHALAAHSRDTPPATVGEVGYMTDSRLREAGFLETDVTQLPGRVAFDYLAPDGVSKLHVAYDSEGSTVKEVSWEPGVVEDKRQLTRPPQTYGEFTDDLYAYAHDFGKRIGKTVTVSTIGADPPEADSDHTGLHHWDGSIVLGSEVPQNILSAAVGRKLSGGKLTPTQMEGVWAATQAGMHEALHGVNPTPKEVYADGGPSMVLEEAMTEELANVEAVKKLESQGQDDVVQWAADNATNAKRLGTYSSYRHALANLLNLAGVEPADREAYLRNLKFRIDSRERIPTIAGDIQRRKGGTLLQAEDTVIATLNGMGRPDEDLQNDFGFVPVLALPVKPNPVDDRFQIAGIPVEVGDVVHTTEKRGWLGSGIKAGRVTALKELPTGWAADVAYDDGSFGHTVLPSQIAGVSGDRYDRLNFGGGDSVDVEDDDGNHSTIKVGDTIEYGPITPGAGNPTNATVTDVIRDRNPLGRGNNTWVIEATLPNGHRVTLTQARAGGHLKKIASADDVPQTPGTAKPLTINQKADVSHAYTTTPDSKVIAVDQIVQTTPAAARDVQDEIQRLRGMGEQRPPLLTSPRIDGRQELLERPEALEAAKATGLTHLPVREAPLPVNRALRNIDEAAENRRKAIAVSDNAHDRGLLLGLQRAHQIVRNGGGLADIAADSALHRDKQGGRMTDFEEGYHVGLRQAWHEVNDAIKQASFAAYAYQSPRQEDERWEANVAVAQRYPGSGGLWGWFKHKEPGREPLDLDKLPVGGNLGVAAEDAQGVRWYLRRRSGDQKLQAKQHFGDPWQLYAGDPNELEIIKTGEKSSEKGLFSPDWAASGAFGAVAAPFLERPFESTMLKAHGPNRRALVRDAAGKEFRVEWAKEQDKLFVDPSDGQGGFKQSPEPTDVSDLPALTITGFAPEQSYLPPPPPKPITDDGGQVTTTKPAGGSNGAMFAKDKAGTEWLVKTYRGDEDRVATELLSNSIYRELGITVPEAGELHFGGKVALGYPLLDGAEQKWDAPNAELGEGFMADALLANWDVVGLAQDNVLWDPDGHPIRLDQGGTLSFRAMGTPKPFGPVPSEVWTMNQPNGQAFGRMLITPQSKREGAAQIAATLTPERIDALVDAAPYKDGKIRERVREALHSRVAWMGDYAEGKVEEPRPLSGDHAAITLAARQASMDLAPEEHLAATAWAEGWHSVVNDALRTKQPKKDASKEQRFLERALGSLTRAKQTKLEQPVEGWMTLPKTTLPKGGGGEIVGRTLSDPGFTNLGLADPGDGVRVRVLIPAGKSALYLRGLPDTPMPDDGPDLVLPRGSRIRIMGETDGVLDGVLV